MGGKFTAPPGARHPDSPIGLRPRPRALSWITRKESQMPKKKTESPAFEEALSELEALVERMEGGEMTLEESLGAFERGIALTRICQQALQAAEQKVEILTGNTPDAPTEPFDNAP